MWIKNCQITGSKIPRYHHVPQPNYISTLQCHPGSGLRPLRSHHHPPLKSFSPSLDVAWISAACPLVNNFYTKLSSSKTRHLHPLPSSLMSDTRTQTPVQKQVQGAVRRDLVKVNDLSLKKAPPDSVEFGSGGLSCHAST